MPDHDKHPHDPVKVDTPGPIDARILQQAIGAVEELGGTEGARQIPIRLPQSEENQQDKSSFFAASRDATPPPEERWTRGRSLDGKGEFNVIWNERIGQEAGARSGSAR